MQLETDHLTKAVSDALTSSLLQFSGISVLVLICLLAFSPFLPIMFWALILAIALFVSSFVFVRASMRKPISGEPVGLMDYFKKGNPRLHVIGIVGGIIWSVGMSFSIIASGAAGPAISYGLGQGATLVAAFWGVFIWKEFKDAPKGTNKLLAAMFLCFIVGLSLIIAARIA